MYLGRSLLKKAPCKIPAGNSAKALHKRYIAFSRISQRLITKLSFRIDFWRNTVLTYTVLDGRVKRINDGRPSVSHPIGLVHGFPQFTEGVFNTEQSQVQDTFQVIVGRQFQFLVELLELLVVQ